jgi:deazaflavin-dependent oxidoreductase (nitroreductase family)
VTIGRKTGQPHEIEIWFAMREDASAIYLLSGGGDRSDWVRNIAAHPDVSARIGAKDAPMTPARARIVTDADQDAEARRRVLEKYRPRYSGDLTRWARIALPVVIESG